MVFVEVIKVEGGFIIDDITWSENRTLKEVFDNK